MFPHLLAPGLSEGLFHQSLCFIIALEQEQTFCLSFKSHEWSTHVSIAVGNSNRRIEEGCTFGGAVEPVQPISDQFKISNLSSNVPFAYRRKERLAHHPARALIVAFKKADQAQLTRSPVRPLFLT